MRVPGNWGSDCSFPVLLHDDSILGQLLLDQNDFLLTLYNEITPCEEIRDGTYKSCTQKWIVNETVLLLSFCVIVCVPGSRGHSLSFENSMGVFPVRTQFELRSMIGILRKAGELYIYNILFMTVGCFWVKINKQKRRLRSGRKEDDEDVWSRLMVRNQTDVTQKDKLWYLPMGNALRMILWLPRVYSMSTVMGAE